MAVRSFGRDLRASLFMLDPEAALLNHGSYGAVPRPVHEAHVALLREVERHPDHWFSTKQPALFREACNAVAAFVGVPGSDLTLVENATTAVNTVLRGAPLSSDQGVLITSLTYRACRIAAEVACAARGATLHSLEIRLPVASPEAIVQLYAEFLEAHPDISLVLLDHITSPSAMVMPVPELVALCHGRGARVMVDGAHAPGQLPLDIGQLQPDYYTGACAAPPPPPTSHQLRPPPPPPPPPPRQPAQVGVLPARLCAALRPARAAGRGLPSGRLTLPLPRLPGELQHAGHPGLHAVLCRSGRHALPGQPRRPGRVALMYTLELVLFVGN